MAEIGGSSRLVVQTFAQCRWNSHKLKQREIFIYITASGGDSKLDFFSTKISLYFPEKSWNGKLLQLPYNIITTTCLVCERVRKKERQIFNHELHKRKVEQSRLCMLFQVSKLNEHLSIINHSQNHMCRSILQRCEREKRSVFDFHPRENSRMPTKPTKLFSFYFLQLLWHLARQYTFSSCIVAWVLLTEKKTY